MRLLLLFGFVAWHVRLSSASNIYTNYEGMRDVTNSAEIFSNRFLQVVADKEYSNMICSPISTLMVLSMLSYGAANETQRELRTVLRLPGDVPTRIGFSFLIRQLSVFKEVEFHLANKIFLGYNIIIPKNEFERVTRITFHSKPQSLNFNNKTEANKIINDWSSNYTNNRINKFIAPDDFDSSTLIMLSSVTYFKGRWAAQFDPKLTTDRPFYINGIIVKLIPTMYRFGSYRFGELPELNARYIEIPYKNRDISDAVSMYIILPDDHIGIMSLRKNFEKLTPKAFSAGVNRDVHLYLPKFAIESKLDLNNPVIEMGIRNIFHYAANFANITEKFNMLRVSKIIQKAVIEVDEEGGKVPLTTDADLGIIKFDYERSPPISFMVEHPFISIISTANGLTLFGSIIMDPSIETKQNDSNNQTASQETFETSTKTSTVPSSANITYVTNLNASILTNSVV